MQRDIPCLTGTFSSSFRSEHCYIILRNVKFYVMHLIDLVFRSERRYVMLRKCLVIGSSQAKSLINKPVFLGVMITAVVSQEMLSTRRIFVSAYLLAMLGSSIGTKLYYSIQFASEFMVSQNRVRVSIDRWVMSST